MKRLSLIAVRIIGPISGAAYIAALFNKAFPEAIACGLVLIASVGVVIWNE